MGQNQAYTVQMRNATGPDGTGGNPRVGVPVRFSRPQICFAPLSCVCPPCLPSPSPLSHTHTLPPSQAIKDSPHASPNDAVRAGAPTKQSAPIMLQAEGHNPTANRVRDVASPSTLEISPHHTPSFRLHPHPRLPPHPNSHFTTHPSALIAAHYPRPHSRFRQPLAHVPVRKTKVEIRIHSETRNKYSKSRIRLN